MRPLFLRLFAGVLIAVAASHAVASAGFALQLVAGGRREAVGRVERHADELVAQLNALPPDARRDALFAMEESHGVPLRIVEPPPGPVHPPLPHAYPLDDGRLLLVDAPPGPPLGPLSWVAFVAQVLAVVGVVAGVGYALARPLVRDLRALEDTVAKLGRGELAARAEVPEGSAVAPLAAGMNGMADKVDALLRDQRQLFQAVSHELRTPHARIRFQLEALRDADEAAERETLVRSIDDDLTELDGLVDELLTYLRYDVETPSPTTEAFAVSPVLEDLVDRLAPMRPEVTLSFGPVGGSVIGQRRGFQRAVENLVTNAQRHAKSRVEVRVEREGAVFLVHVDDDGPGVPEAQRERIFEPFITSEASRSRRFGGVGLGLAIVRRILAHHGGTASVGVSPLGGARFTLRWPGV